MTPIYRRAAGIVPRRIEACLFVAVPASNRILELDAIGAALWNALAKPRSAEEIVALFASAFPGIPTAGIRRDMSRALAQMTRDGLIAAGAAKTNPARGMTRRRRARQ